MYGLFPCQASTPLIDKAILENKNLLIAFCGCNYCNDFYTGWFVDYWANAVCDEYSYKYGDSFKISGRNEEMGTDYPNLTYKKK